MHFAPPSLPTSRTHLLLHHTQPPLIPLSRLLLLISLRNIQPQPIRIQIQLIPSTRILQNTRNLSGIFDPPQIHIAAALLDGVTDQLGRASLTLGAHHSGLFFLAGFVDDEGGALGFLLGDLLGFHGGGEFGGEGEVLEMMLSARVSMGYGIVRKVMLTVRETSSSIMLNLAALLARFSLTSLATFSRCVIS